MVRALKEWQICLKRQCKKPEINNLDNNIVEFVVGVRIVSSCL